MTVVVFIVPEVKRTAAAEEIRPRTFANAASFPLGNRLLPDGEIRPSTFANLDEAFFRPRLTTGDEFNIKPALFSNEAEQLFGAANEVAESPPDGTIRPSLFSNEAEQVFGAANTVVVSPADGVIRPSTFTNTDEAFGNNVVSPAGEDDYGPIGVTPIGGSPI